MSFYVVHRYGEEEDGVSLDALPALLAELDGDPRDGEHPDVAVVHDSNWSIVVASSREVTLEHVEDMSLPSRSLQADRSEALALLRSLAAGDLETVMAAAWAPMSRS